MKSTLRVLFCIAMVFMFTRCAAPETFIKTSDLAWAKIELKDGITYSQAWRSIYDLLVKKFDIDVADKNNGYIRTNYNYTWTGDVTDYYKVRVTVKFSEDQKTLEIKSEAYYKDYLGYDSRLLETMKSDIMGIVGRTTR